MPTPKKGPRLGGSPAHQKLLLANLAAQLIEHRAITTTEAKARALQPYVEKLVTKAKRGDIHARRTVARKILNKDVLYMLFDEVVPAMDPERNGGYTRITKLGPRRGDNAPMARIELVMEKVEKKAVVADAERTASKAAAKSGKDSKATGKADEKAETEAEAAETAEPAADEAASQESADDKAETEAEEAAK